VGRPANSQAATKCATPTSGDKQGRPTFGGPEDSISFGSSPRSPRCWTTAEGLPSSAVLAAARERQGSATNGPEHVQQQSRTLPLLLMIAGVALDKDWHPLNNYAVRTMPAAPAQEPEHLGQAIVCSRMKLMALGMASRLTRQGPCCVGFMVVGRLQARMPRFWQVWHLCLLSAIAMLIAARTERSGS
jgi:hypothetical protein